MTDRKCPDVQSELIKFTMIPITNKWNCAQYWRTYICKFYFEQINFSCHTSAAQGRIGQLRKIQNMQISIRMLDRAHKM